MNLLEFTREKPPAEQDLETIGTFLLASLSEHLGQEVACFNEHFVAGEALAMKIRNKTPMPGPFALQWDGSLLYGVREAEPAIHAYIFLYSHGERLGALKDNGNGWMILAYDIKEGNGIWSFSHWHFDDFDEWTYVKKPRTELYDKFERTYG